MLNTGAVVFFSGTGNTKYIAKLFKERFKEENVNIELIDIQKENSIKKDYDFYIIGSPIHVEKSPKILMDWISKNVPTSNKKCITYYTLADDGHKEYRVDLAKIMKEKGYDVIINTSIKMPNNYYHVIFKRDSDEVIKEALEEAPSKVDKIVKDFLAENRSEIAYNKQSKSMKLVYDMFLIYAKKYAKRKFSVDKDKCINCKICENECPTKNILMNDINITFYNKCIGCEKCIHRCPTNAILYKNKPFEPYKIEEYLK